MLALCLRVLFIVFVVPANGLLVGSTSPRIMQEKFSQQTNFQRRSVLQMGRSMNIRVPRRERLLSMVTPRRQDSMKSLSLSSSAPEPSNSTEKESKRARLKRGVKKGLSNIQVRWITGLLLGAFGTYLIYSPKWFFVPVMTLIMLTVQREYFKMVASTGVEPASKTGYLTGIAFFLMGAYVPVLHELILPSSITFLMIWLLLFKKKISSISEISSTLLGVIYFGFLPSFWMRLRYEFGPAMRQTLFHKFGSSTLGLDWLFSGRQYGAMVLWWSICSIVCSDVGAYFAGKAFGKHKLAEVCKAAGAASPNKTVEGAIGGWILSTLFFTLGTYLMQWPNWHILGPLYGLSIGVLGLVGDLMASMMKRDANLKDSGGVLPGHGGLIDRFDSYILSGPLCYFAVKLIMPHRPLPIPVVA